MWSAIEVAPGKYDWRDYDRMIAAQNGIIFVKGHATVTRKKSGVSRRYRAGDDSTAWVAEFAQGL